MGDPDVNGSVHVRAPGKINVFLRVGEVREDGYHDLATAYQAVSLYEDVVASHDDGFSVSFTGSVDVSELPTDASNLAVRAARAPAVPRAPRDRQERPDRRRHGRRVG
jgi:4-diphosphocytidyl-2-C-methyl-D-erythritol kinase